MGETQEEPHITIDAYNLLYILHATKKEEAIYTCKVDGIKMQKFNIRIVSKSRLLNQGLCNICNRYIYYFSSTNISAIYSYLVLSVLPGFGQILNKNVTLHLITIV